MSTELSPLDASFLAVETPTAHMHVGWAAVLSPPPNGGRPGFEELREHIGRRLARAPRYRQKLRSVPLGIGRPVWTDDPEFDLSRHLLHMESGRLRDVIDSCMSEPLPRDRPLWQLRIAPRLDDGRIAVVGKAHHCMVDGIAAVELASLMLDAVPDPVEPASDGWSPRPSPAGTRLALDAIAQGGRRGMDLVTLPFRMAGTPQRALSTARDLPGASRALLDAVRPAPPTKFLNDPISPRRHLALLGRPLEDLTRIKRGFDVKLNDVVLAACAGGVRRFLLERGQAPIRLKAMVPVSVRGENGAEELGNRISFIFVDLPCDEPDPVRRLRQIHEATWKRKTAGNPQGAEAVLGSLGFAPRPIQTVVSKLAASPRAFNLVVSNIPGPSEPLYMRGCLLEEAFPVVPLADRHALSIGVTTIRDRACFGLYADREVLPDSDRLAVDMDLEIDELDRRIPAARRPRARPAPAPVG